MPHSKKKKKWGGLGWTVKHLTFLSKCKQFIASQEIVPLTLSFLFNIDIWWTERAFHKIFVLFQGSNPF